MATKLNIGLILLLVTAFLGILSLYFMYNPSEFTFFPKCPFHSITNLYCPGCGSQRAIHDMLHGNIIEGLKHNALILLLALVLIYELIVLLMRSIFKKSMYNVLHNSKITYAILYLVILFLALRNVNVLPFNFLAP